MTTNDIDLYPTIAARIGDPGAYVPRKLTPSGEPMETVPRWAARAVVGAVQPIIDDLAAALAKARKDRDEYAEDNTRVAVALIDVQRKLAGLDADHRSAVQANTAYANENARLRSQLAEADLAISSMRAAIDEADGDGDDKPCCGYGCNDNLTGVTR